MTVTAAPRMVAEMTVPHWLEEFAPKTDRSACQWQDVADGGEYPAHEHDPAHHEAQIGIDGAPHPDIRRAAVLLPHVQPVVGKGDGEHGDGGDDDRRAPAVGARDDDGRERDGRRLAGSRRGDGDHRALQQPDRVRPQLVEGRLRGGYRSGDRRGAGRLGIGALTHDDLLGSANPPKDHACRSRGHEAGVPAARLRPARSPRIKRTSRRSIHRIWGWWCQPLRITAHMTSGCERRGFVIGLGLRPIQ